MRVGVYFPRTPESVGGGFTFEAEILRALAELSPGECSHEMLAFHDLPHLPDDFAWGRLTPVWIAPLLYPRRPVRLYRKVMRRLLDWTWPACPPDALLQLLREHRIEFMYYPTPQPLTLEVPYLITVWDLQHRLQPHFPEVSANGLWELREQGYRLDLPRAASVITANAAGREELERFYGIPASRVETIPHPTPLSALDRTGRHADRVRAKYGLPADYLLYPAQFWPHKNHVGLVRALHLLHQRGGPRPHLVLPGSDQGNLAHVRRVVNDLGLADRVHFLGFIPREDLLDLYVGAAALVYVTYFGPENLPPLEAFGLGCPVIASKVSGAEEQLGNAALPVDPSSEAEIAAAIESLYADPALRAELVRRGRDRAERFTARHFVRRVIGVLDRFAALRRCWPAA